MKHASPKKVAPSLKLCFRERLSVLASAAVSPDLFCFGYALNTNRTVRMIARGGTRCGAILTALRSCL